MRNNKWILLGCGVFAACAAHAQELETMEESGGGFLQVILGGGVLGVILWLALLLLSVAGCALIVDSFLNVRTQKIIPPTLPDAVREKLAQGDPQGAESLCTAQPGPLARILSAACGKPAESPEAIQDRVALSVEMEGEKLMQRINYLNVVGNLAPMLGLLGTVQGMILAFATLGTSAGAAKNAMLAINISQALYTTAAGLVIAVPALGFFYFFRNRSAKLMLQIEMLTLDLLKNTPAPPPCATPQTPPIGEEG